MIVRRLMGGLFLAAGVGGLGWYGTANTAQRIETQITAAADSVAEMATYTVESSVSGRDITASGVVESHAEFDSLLAAFQDVEGRRTVDMSAVTVLPMAEPFELTAMRAEDGTATMSGAIPNEEARAALAATTSDDLAAGLVWSAGAPDDDWTGVAATSFDALGLLKSGEMTLSGTTLTVRGLAATPSEKEGVEAALASLPEGYTVESTIDVEDDGTPLRLNLTLADGSVTGDGKLPAGFAASKIADMFGGTEGLDILEASIPSDDDKWPDFATTGMDALADLISGDLAIEEKTLTLTGVASPEGKAVAEQALANLPDGYFATFDIQIFDDGAPPVWSLVFDASQGARAEGKLPDGLTLDGITDMMGLPEIDGDPVLGAIPASGSSALGILSLASEYLPQTERLIFRNDAEGKSLDMIMSPGVSVDLVAIDLAERLPTDVAFTIGPLDVLPNDGAVRTNQATSQRERFQFGNWLPILTFAPVATICRDQSQAALEGTGVNFLSSLATLDAKSIRAINTLAAVAQRCVDEGGLRLEVGGHTDSTGSEISNQLLSENRANAVREALIARGVDPDAIAAVGYGQSRPIGDNGTPEGRAQNRRTEINWSE